MPLPYGCTHLADDKFKLRHNLTSIASDEQERYVYFRGGSFNNIPIMISPMYDDCTSCTLVLGYLKPQHAKAAFTLIQEYMAISARITALFTKKVRKAEIPKWLEALKEFQILGLHIQKSNREPDSDCYMITGMLKVPNPVVNDYNHWNQEYPSDHDLTVATKFNEVNKEFNLPTI